MLTADVRFEGWSPVDWGRFLSLFAVVDAAGRDPVRRQEHAARGGLIVVHDGGRVRKALHTIDGRVDPRAIGWPPDPTKIVVDSSSTRSRRAPPSPLEALAQEQRVQWLWTIASGALEELMERFGARVRRGDDALSQALILFAAFRELIDEGEIESWPRRMQGVPIPARSVVDKALDSLVPAGTAITLALYEQGELWTSMVLRRAPVLVSGSAGDHEPARFDLIAGPSQLRREMGVLSGDFRRDHRHHLDAVRALYAPVSLGVHAELSTIRSLITSASPGDWARAAALRDVVLDPVPLVLALPLSLDATRGVLGLAAKMVRRLDPFGVAHSLLDRLGAAFPALPAAAPGKPGFDPLDALRKLLNR